MPEKTPYPFQQVGAMFLAGRKRGMCCDVMGLGKTAQGIVASDMVHATRILVICPGGVRFNWLREFKRFSDTKHEFKLILTGKDKPLEKGVTIISYDLAIRPAIRKKLMSMYFDVLILDESHFLKSRDKKRTETVYGVHCKGDTGIISRATHCWALTATPTPNHPGEIYSVLRAFGAWTQNYYAFEAKFCVVVEGDFGPKIVGMKNVDELKELVKPFMIRRKIEEVMTDLPQVTFSDIVLDANGISNPEDIKDWRDAEESREGRLLKTRLQEVADENKLDLSDMHLPTLRRLTGLAKVRPVCELVMRELDSGLDKIVIFGEHRDVLEGVRATLQKYGSQIIYGGNTAEVKQERIDRFINIYKYRVLIGHIKTLGTGVDGLQAVCNNGLFIESSWTPSDNYQAVGRLRRTGQTRPVLFRFASLADSLDEHVQRANRRKTQIISQLLD